jgi:hydrogenase maturation protein HypF
MERGGVRFMNRVKIIIHGVVQGVGFRPFVYRLATELGIKGWIINSSQGVFIDAEGCDQTVNDFLTRLKTDKPKNSFIQSFEYSYLDPAGFENFKIKESKESGAKTALVLPDISTCDDCLKEIFNPNNRRYLYPFTNCTNCGPRFSIIKSLPYDRANTTMQEFEMCPACYEEYTDPSNRRFHAEPIACPNCGPQVELLDWNGNYLASKDVAISVAAELIAKGMVVALKGIGGYQLICDARNTDAINALRTNKHRNEKPFALMFPSLESVKIECEVSDEEERLLTSVESPIVLLKKKSSIESKLSDDCAKGNPNLGVMLPYSPLHHILMRKLKIPVIATSGNISEEPICIDEKSALNKLGGIADYFLVHNRKIMRHVDDSISRIIAGREMLIRRARGYAPLPVQIEGLDGQQVFAAGAHLKNTVAMNNGSNVFISQHIGDLENTESISAFKNVISDFENFYEIKPVKNVCDLHPDYISTKYVKELNENTLQVQHHWAHVLSCIAENNIEGDVLGVSWDGTGYGTDGTIWGGEFLVPEGNSFRRAAHLKTFRLPGGEKAIHEIWRIGYSLLYEIFGVDAEKYMEHDKNELVIIEQMLRKGINSPVTSSMGRLFDGVASILNIRQNANFEAQGAMELEFAADENETNSYNFAVENENEKMIIDWHTMLKEIITDLKNGIPNSIISAKFHNTLTEIILSVAQKVNKEKILLTGGCFQNKYLLENSIIKLEKNGFKVYRHQRVPTNDGGISLGQIKYAANLSSNPSPLREGKKAVSS